MYAITRQRYNNYEFKLALPVECVSVRRRNHTPSISDSQTRHSSRCPSIMQVSAYGRYTKHDHRTHRMHCRGTRPCAFGIDINRWHHCLHTAAHKQAHGGALLTEDIGRLAAISLLFSSRCCTCLPGSIRVLQLPTAKHAASSIRHQAVRGYPRPPNTS